MITSEKFKTESWYIFAGAVNGHALHRIIISGVEKLKIVQQAGQKCFSSILSTCAFILAYSSFVNPSIILKQHLLI